MSNDQNIVTVERVNACLAACEGVEAPERGELAELRDENRELAEALEYWMGDARCKGHEGFVDENGPYSMTCIELLQDGQQEGIELCHVCRARAVLERRKERQP